MEKQHVIRTLGLTPHFEGGYFAETFRSDAAAKIVTARGERLAMTAIYFLLDDVCPLVAFHSKHSDGIQFHLKGAPVTYHLIHSDGAYEKIVLGPDIENGQWLQLSVKGGTWKAIELEAGDYGLVSEVVSPRLGTGRYDRHEPREPLNAFPAARRTDCPANIKIAQPGFPKFHHLPQVVKSLASGYANASRRSSTKGINYGNARLSYDPQSRPGGGV